MVVLIDPSDDPDDVLRINRSREKQYVFDVTFDGNTTQVHFNLYLMYIEINYFFPFFFGEGEGKYFPMLLAV